jgi:hypothetical protein
MGGDVCFGFTLNEMLEVNYIYTVFCIVFCEVGAFINRDFIFARSTCMKNLKY